MELLLAYKNSKETYVVSDMNSTTVGDLKSAASEMFGLDRGTCRLIFKGAGKPLDASLLRSLTLKSNKVMVLGTTASHLMTLKNLDLQQVERDSEKKKRDDQDRILIEQKLVEETIAQEQRLEEERQAINARELQRQLEISIEQQRLDDLRHCRVTLEVTTLQSDRVGLYRGIFPVSVLETAELGSQSFPLVFKACGSFVGVQEFSATSGCVIVGPEVHLSGYVRFEVVPTVKGTGATFQVLEKEWLLIPSDEREALLEFELRKLPFLNATMKIPLCYCGHIYTLTVLSTLPAELITLAETELITDVVPPDELPDELPVLVPGTTEACLIQSQLMTFVIDVASVHSVITIEAIPLDSNADFDIFASFTNTSPDLFNNTWSAEEFGSVSLQLSNNDPHYTLGPLYISVFCCGTDGRTRICLTIEESPKTTSHDETVTPDEGIYCDNCLKCVPSSSLNMHQLQCYRLNWKCPDCTKIIRAQGKSKHLERFHAIVKCLCSKEFSGIVELRYHLLNSCMDRIVRCIYCPMRMSARDRGPHQQECGNRPSFCKECSLPLRRKEQKRHLVRDHSYSPSLVSYKDFA